MNADDLAVRMPRDWGLDPNPPTFVGLSSGVAGCLLDGLPGEVSNPASDNHILSFVVRGDPHHRQWHDGRQILNGFLPSRSVNIVPAGRVPRAVISAPVRVLHVYLPHRHMVETAASLESAGNPLGLEIIDPCFAPDPDLVALLGLLEGAMRLRMSTDKLWREALCGAISARVIQRWSNLAPATTTLAGTRAPALAPWQVRRAIERLAADLAAEPSLSDLAAEAGLSPFHFARAFKASTGRPPHRQLVELRLAKARELLETTDRSVTDIAAAVGYDDPGYLARLFRKEIGLTPAAYRRERRS